MAEPAGNANSHGATTTAAIPTGNDIGIRSRQTAIMAPTMNAAVGPTTMVAASIAPGARTAPAMTAAPATGRTTGRARGGVSAIRT